MSAKKNAGVITIIISVDAHGNITYIPSVQNVSPGDRVRWVTDAGPFALTFQTGQPFGKVNFSGQEVNGVFMTADAPVTGPPGSYHYQTAIFAQQANRVLLTAGCPEIIVD